MTTQLSLYNAALTLFCGERPLAALTDNVESRRLLDVAWDDGAVDYCLGQGQWSFARRSMQMAPSTSVEPDYGYSLAYEIPSDLVRTLGVWSDEYGQVPLTQYIVESGYWFTDVQPIYVSYVSNDASYGADMSKWPPEFVLAVEAYLASRIIRKLKQSEDEEDKLQKKTRKLFQDAASSDAMEGPTKFPPLSSWAQSRISGARGDRGNRGRLIG